MELKHYSQELLKKEILEIIGRHLDLTSYKIFFFGSRTSVVLSEKSDIDVGIEGKREIPGETMSKIREEIESLPTLYKIEVIDFKKTSRNFRNLALQNIEVINP